MCSPEEPSHSGAIYRRELLRNQFWQILNFGSKAGFLILLTPMMLSRWGSVGYGLFALASSLLVSMALLDGGVRSLTRIRMAEAWKRGDTYGASRIYAEGVLTFAGVSLVAVAATVILSLGGCLTAWFRLPAGGSGVLVLTVICTAILMTSILVLEPLAARGNLSVLKAANTWGALAAIPLCALLVSVGTGQGGVILAYAACMTVPNLFVAFQNGLFALIPCSELRRFRPATALKTLREGFWYYLTTISLIGKTHGLTFLVSAIAGPGEAGIFYILLRFSEIISNVASTSSETSLAALTSASGIEARRACFTQSWIHAALFSMQGALVFLFLTSQLLGVWLHGAVTVPAGVGLGLALFGLSGSFSRVVVNSSMGLDLTRPAAFAGLWEALLGILGAYAGYRLGGLTGLFLGASIGFLCLIPVSHRIALRCGWHSSLYWLGTLRQLLPGFFCSGMLLLAGASVNSMPIAWIGSLAVAGVITLHQVSSLHPSGKKES